MVRSFGFGGEVLVAYSTPPVKRRSRQVRWQALFNKIRDAHVVEHVDDDTCVLYIDHPLLGELHSVQTGPTMAAGAAVTGRLTNGRKLG